jgi:transcriptional regulator with XRE-family HTH domain
MKLAAAIAAALLLVVLLDRCRRYDFGAHDAAADRAIDRYCLAQMHADDALRCYRCWGFVMDVVNKAIGAQLNAQGMSQEALADAIGLTRVQINKIVNGRRRVSSLELALVADALDVNVEDLLYPMSSAARYRAEDETSPEARAADEWFIEYIRTSERMRVLDAADA